MCEYTYYSKRTHPRSKVYFIRATQSGHIKIGRSVDVQTRMRALWRESGQTLELLATIPGGPYEERVLHHIFRDDRLYGEWFRPSPRLLSFVDTIDEYCNDDTVDKEIDFRDEQLQAFRPI